MSNTNGKSENVINEACNTYLIGDHSSSLHSASSPSSSSSSVVVAAAAAAAAASSSSSFVNGDLIDLCDQINEHESSLKYPVEAINSQLLADLNGKSLQQQLQHQLPPPPPLMLPVSKDCHILYPTKVSFDNNNVLSGTTQQNHINQPNSNGNSNGLLSTVVSARSAEAIGQSSESNLMASALPPPPPTTQAMPANEQHQTQVFREFKRIGTYCTLRPEQRRKHLLKVLPTLRNSMLLQTLFGSNTTPKSFTKTHNNNSSSNAASSITTTDEQKQQQLMAGGTHDIDSLLIDLDDFIIDSNITRMQRLSNHETPFDVAATLSSSSGYGGRHSNDMSAAGYVKMVDPDKVEDCLLELDAYLEEIDREYVLACAAHGSNTMISAVPSSASSYSSSSSAITTTAIAAAVSAATSQPLNNGTIVASPIRNSNGNSMKISANESAEQNAPLRNHSVRPPTIDNSHTSCIDCDCGDRHVAGHDCITANTNATAAAATVAVSAPNLRKPFNNDDDGGGHGDIQMNECGKVMTSTMASNEINGPRTTDNQRKSNDIANNQPLKRGHKLRNTVAGSGHNQNRAIASYDAPSQCVDTSTRDTRPVKNVALSWRRLSMRKTCPIVLPEQNPPIAAISSSQYAVRPGQIARTTSAVLTSTRTNALAADFTNSTNATNANRSASHFGNDNYNYTEIRNNDDDGSGGGGDEDDDDDGANNAMPSTLNEIGQQRDRIDYDGNHQLPELSSLNSEFLTTILSTPNYQQSSNSSHNNNNANANCAPMHHETNFVHNSNSIEQDCNDSAATTTAAAVVANTSIAYDDSRPRQLGRRSEMRSRIVSITAEHIAEGNPRIIVNCDTDNVPSATQSNCSPSTNPSTTQSIQSQSSTSSLQRLSTQCQFTDGSSVASSRNPSPVSIASSSESSSGGSTSAGETNIRSTSTHRTMSASCGTATSATNRTNNNNSNSSNGSNSSSASAQRNQSNSKTRVWPYGFSRIFAATCCTLGLFNMSRFSIFSIIFGANFIVQFLLLSFFLGIPMLWLQMCLGSNIRGGPISMWRVSPICKGIGIALVLVQALMAIYSAVSIAWLFTYLRDSCVSTRYPWYRWQEVFEFFRGPSDNSIAMMSTNTSEPSASASKLGETVADYFNGIILQRQLGPGGRASGVGGIGAVRFQLAFNLSVVWLLVFVILCKGLRLYGKIVIALVSVPMITFFALTTKMLTLLNLAGFQNIFPATDWQDFFVNSQSWLSAAQEAFLTWSLLGASIISIFSRPSKGQQQDSAADKTLRRDALLVVLFTLIGLLLAAVFGNACVQILNDRGFYYFPGSFETLTSSAFLSPSSKPMSPQLATSLSKWLPRYSTLLGESYKRIDPNSFESGWQPIRIVTEIFPATLAAATIESASSFWSLLGFATFLCFGLAQLCAMWKPIATSMCSYSESISATSTTILLTCLAALLLGIPLTTESGINIIYFLDSVIGGAWFVLLLWTGLLLAIFLVRGRPYSGDILVNRLHLGLTLSAFVALSWNLLLPIGLLTLCVLQYKISYSYDFYHWSGIISQSYWPIWTRKAAAFIQIGIFQIIPITAIIQTYRYLSKGPPDILDRFQLLYRPPISASQRSHRYPLARSDRSPLATGNNRQSDANTGSSTIPAIAVTMESPSMLDDAPPKYTPPPSYSTATGARIAKLLRNSIRRSVRRILGEPNCNVRRQRAALQTVESSFDQNPPEYSTIVSTSLAITNTTPNHDHLERNGANTASETNRTASHNAVSNSDTYRHQHHHHQISASNARRHTTTNFPSQKSLEKMDSFSSTMPRRQNPVISSTSTNERCNFRNLTAHDVAQLLRSTPNTNTQLIRSEANSEPLSPTSIDSSSFPIDSDLCMTISTTTTTPTTMGNDNIHGHEQEDYSLTRSVEELILNEVPIGESNAAATFCDK